MTGLTVVGFSGGYDYPQLLVDTSWLAQHLEDTDVRIVDTGSPDAYARAHIPSAVNIPHNYIKGSQDATHVMPAEELARLTSQLGVGNETLVVAYDHSDSLYAARLWWVLDYYGHTGVSVLNGGWLKWLEEGKPVTANSLPTPPAGPFTPRANPSTICDIDYLRGCIGNPDRVILDVRSLEEYAGENPRNNKRPGHIPGAIHLEWREAIDPKSHAFKPADELRHMLQEKGVTPEKEVITH